MTKKLMLGAAIGALIVSGAFAQSPNLPSTSGSMPSASSAEIVSSQKPDQWMASKFKGIDVVGADDQKIGDISDILFDKSGNIQAFVISVGGILGVGAKEVALNPKAFTAVPGQNGSEDKLKISMSKEELKNAQTFARHEPPRPATTTGAGGAGGSLGSRPAGAPPVNR